MNERRPLSSTQATTRDEIANKVTNCFRLDLPGGGKLSVSMPAMLSTADAIEVVDQLRELAFAVGSSAGFHEREVIARESLQSAREGLRARSRGVADLDKAREVLASYESFLGVVFDFLRCAER